MTQEDQAGLNAADYAHMRKLTRTIKIDDFLAEAPAEDPKYLVKSGKTGKHAAHKPGALRLLKK